MEIKTGRPIGPHKCTLPVPFIDGVNHCDPPLSPCRAPKTRSKNMLEPSSIRCSPPQNLPSRTSVRGRLVPFTVSPGESHADREILCANQGIGIRLASALHPLVLLSLLLSPFSPRLHFPPTSANHAPNPPIRHSRVLAQHGSDGCKWLNPIWETLASYRIMPFPQAEILKRRDP